MERVIPAAMFVSLIVVGLVAGIFLATQLGQLRVQNTLDARDFTLVKHSFEVALGKVMPVLVIAAGVSIVPLVFLLRSWGPAPFIAVVIALVLWAGVITATLCGAVEPSSTTTDVRAVTPRRCTRPTKFTMWVRRTNSATCASSNVTHLTESSRTP